MAGMRQLAAVVAASVLWTGCSVSTYKITNTELQRLAQQPPEARGERVRVHQQLSEVDASGAEPVTANTQIVLFPDITVSGPRRHHYYRGGGGGGGWSGSGGKAPSGHLHMPSMGGGGGGDKGAAIAILVVAAVALFAVVAVEGSRWDGDVRLHPMHPVFLIGKGGERAILPLAWIDPETARWTEKAYVRRSDGPWDEIGRAPLDRQGWNFSMYGGPGIISGIDGSRGVGTVTEIQLGFFPVHQLGILGTLGFAWRENEVGTTNFHARYGFEAQVFPVDTGQLQVGGYLGIGGAYRSDEQYVDGFVSEHESEAGRMTRGGLMLQLDLTTRIALTGRFGLTDSFGEKTAESLFGLSVY